MSEVHQMEIFTKRGGTSNLGGDFEKLTISKLVLDMVASDAIVNFQLSSDNKKFGAFDDIVFEVEYKEKDLRKYALQLKYLNNEKKGGFQNALLSQEGQFSICKYFSSFQNDMKNVSDYKLILFTNWKTNMKDGERLHLNFNKNANFCVILKLAENPLSDFFDGKCYKFEINNSLENLDYSPWEFFFKNFHILTNQLSVNDLRNEIPKRLENLPFCSSKISENFLEKISSWSKSYESNKYKLNKLMVQKILALSSLDLQSINFNSTTLNIVEKLFCEVTSQCNVTIFNHDESFEKVQKLWSSTYTDLIYEDFKQINNVNRQYLITSYSFFNEETFNKLSDLAKSKLLWLIGKCPLLVRENELTLKGLDVLKNKNIIIFGKCEVKSSEDFSIFRNLFDVKNFKQIETLCQNLKCFIPDELTLGNLVKKDDNLKRNISTDLLLSMLETPYKLSVEEEHFSTIYLHRFLSKILINVKYLESLDHKALVVISGVDNLSNYPFLKKFQTFWINKPEDNKSYSLDLMRKVKIYLNSEMCPKTIFQNICNKNKNLKKFHHFKIGNGEQLEWIFSKSDICELHQFRKETDPMDLTQSQSIDHNNIKIIAGDPGMGKTWFLRNLKKNLTKFTILFSARDMSILCDDFIKSDSKEDLERFLFEYKFKTFTRFDKVLLKKLIEIDQVVFLWDALDEVSNNEQIETILNFINKFSESNSLHWITCRRHLQTTVEKKFNVLSYTIREFNSAEQHKYINKRLKNHYTEKEISKINENIKDHVAFIHFKDILSIPLHIYMLTEILLNDREKFHLLTNSFSIVEVYEYFINEKFQILYKEKLKINKKAINVFRKNEKLKIQNYEKAALTLIFEKKILQNFKIDVKELVDNLDDHESGFIILNDDKTFQFAHISYAEYFAACYLVKNRSIHLKDFLFDERYNNVRFFFDMILAKASPAHQACLCKNFQALKMCKEEELLKTDLAGRNVLQVACSWGERYPLLSFLQKDNKFILEQNYYGIKAAQLNLNFIEIIEYLLNKTFKLDSKDECFQMNFMQYAEICNCWFTFAAIVKKFKLYFSVHREIALSLLIYAILLKWDGIDVLEQFNVPNVETKNKETLLFLASESGSYTVADLLINKGSDVNAADKAAWTPLHIASQNGHEKLVDLLINNSATVNAANKNGITPLYIAAQNDHQKVAMLLVNNGANVDAADKNGYTPLYIASYNGHDKIAQLLIHKVANVNAAHRDGATPLYVAAQMGHEKVAQILISKGAIVHAEGYYTPLHVASEMGHEKVAKLLVNNGANVNAVDKNGNTPLYIAAWMGHEKLAELLIDNGANVEATHNHGCTPLQSASFRGHVKVAQLLINKGAIVNAANKDGNTALDLACLKGHTKVIELLKNRM